MKVFPSMKLGLPPPKALNTEKTLRRSSLGSIRGILRFHDASALCRPLDARPRFAAYAPVKLLGSANLTYSALVPWLCGPPLVTISMHTSVKVCLRISATIATASLNSSNAMRRSPLRFTLLKMMST